MEAYRGARLPALCEVLDFLKGNGMTLNIELKTGEVLYPGLEEKTVEMVHRFGLADRVLYSSFNHYSLVLVRKVDPQAKIGLLYSEPWSTQRSTPSTCARTPSTPSTARSPCPARWRAASAPTCASTPGP